MPPKPCQDTKTVLGHQKTVPGHQTRTRTPCQDTKPYQDTVPGHRARTPKPVPGHRARTVKNRAGTVKKPCRDSQKPCQDSQNRARGCNPLIWPGTKELAMPGVRMSEMSDFV